MLEKGESFVWFINKSLLYDIRFLRFSPWSLQRKLIFILKKYYTLMVYAVLGIKKFELGKSSVNLFGKELYFDLRFGIAGYQATMSVHQRMLQIADVANVKNVLDIGANVGYFSLLARDLYPEARIIAVEPIEETYQALKKNFENDDKVDLVQKAASDFSGEAIMLFDPAISAVSSLGREKSDTANSRKIERSVPVVTLDMLVENLGIEQVDLLKIDVENFEKNVLDKGQKTLKNTRYLFLEISIQDNKQYTISELLGSLFRKGKYNFQLVAFRNFTDEGLGELPVGDFLFKNIYLQ